MKDIKVGILGMCGYSSIHYQTGCKIINTVEEAVKQDILIFSGGEDISPNLYDEEPTFSYPPTPERDILERNVFIQAIRQGVKILGICRGHQLINAVLGGKLYQDIYQETGIEHGIGRIKPAFGEWKSVHDFTPDAENHWSSPILAEIFPKVNSLHHQAVKTPGTGMGVLLYARDGIIEATANKEKSIVSFQFHPEWLPHGYFKKMMETGQLIW